MDRKTQWLQIKLSFLEDIEIPLNELKKILNKVEISYKYIIKNIIILDSTNNISEQTKQKLTEEINKYLPDTDEGLVELEVEQVSEILFDLEIKNPIIDEDEFVSYLARVSDSEIAEYDNEINLIKKVDYNEENYSKTPLLHNIRCENIAIFTLKTLDLGIAFIGYMKFRKTLKVTIKVFNFDLLKYLTEEMSSLFDEIEWEDNINWKLLFEREVSQGYREHKKHICQNNLMKSFLTMSKANDDDGKIRLLLKCLLDKGYLNEENYAEIASLNGITRFLQKYNRILKNNLGEHNLWIDINLGVVFKERDKSDPERIQELNTIESIYAPPEHLLHYVRAYWHQEYVESIFKNVKEKINSAENGIEIIEIVTDYQFDLIRTGKPIKSSRDIDLLLRVKNVQQKSEYIIAVEAKRNAAEFSTVRKDITEKISTKYANIFSGFIAVAYFDKGEQDIEESVVQWGEEEDLIEKLCILCSSTEIDLLETKIISAINRICI
ncbi:hypothetical protein [Lysinibacillus sp. NPDC047702]|uniref:hypothetical protein n=1 Tax=unclassified Lysinibacillus TaxID=2636778 RepID=UPI003D032938